MTQRLPELGRALLVEIDPELDHSRRAGLYYAIKHCPGVAAVVDVAAISRETLDVMLLPDDQKIPLKKRR